MIITVAELTGDFSVAESPVCQSNHQTRIIRNPGTDATIANTREELTLC